MFIKPYKFPIEKYNIKCYIEQASTERVFFLERVLCWENALAVGMELNALITVVS